MNKIKSKDISVNLKRKLSNIRKGKTIESKIMHDIEERRRQFFASAS